MPKRLNMDVDTQMQCMMEYFQGTKVSELLRRYGMSSSHFYRLRDRFFEGARAALVGGTDKSAQQHQESRVAELERALGRVTVENQILKKTLR